MCSLPHFSNNFPILVLVHDNPPSFINVVAFSQISPLAASPKALLGLWPDALPQLGAEPLRRFAPLQATAAGQQGGQRQGPRGAVVRHQHAAHVTWVPDVNGG